MRRRKFLFDESLPEEYRDRAIENVLSLMSDHFIDAVPDRLSAILREKNLSKVVFAIIRPDTGERDFLDYRDLYRVHLDTQK